MNSLQLPRLGAGPNSPFPSTGEALERPNGLLAWGGGLEPERLLAAYRMGIFPWFSPDEPILWWSPAPRCVLVPAQVHLSRRTRRRFNTGEFTLTADSAFREVISGCAEPRGENPGTWITAELQEGFNQLHDEGYAHSIEVWREQNLVGGIYGLALGEMFFGESMFSRETDASKIALVALCRQLESWGFGLLDCQVPNKHLKSMGAIRISRLDFEHQLQHLIQQPGHHGSWSQCFTASECW